MKCNGVMCFLMGNSKVTDSGAMLKHIRSVILDRAWKYLEQLHSCCVKSPYWMPLFRCQLKRKVKKQVEDRKLESKMAGCGQYCWVRLITVHSLGRQSVRVPTIGSWSGWQHGQSWAAFASVPATEGQAYWEAVWWTQWVRQTCCINRLFAAVARNKP